MIDILKISNIFDLNNYDGKKYLLPDSVRLYYMLKDKFYEKTLLPINFHNKDTILIYKKKKTLKFKFDFTNIIDDADIIIYENIEEFENYTNIEGLKKDKLVLNNSELDENNINSIINIYRYYLNTRSEDVIENLLNFDYEFLNLEIDLYKEYVFDKNKLYIIKRNGTKLYNINDIILDYNQKVLYNKEKNFLYMIDNKSDKEFVIFCRFEKSVNIKLLDLINNSILESKVIGFNNDNIDEKKLFYLYGYCRLYELYRPLLRLHKIYVKLLDDNNNNFNKRKLVRIYFFNGGLVKNNYNDVEKEYKNIKVNSKFKKVLLISKMIKGYGGNQKTARQLYYNLEKYYDVKILSVCPSRRGNWNFKNDYLCKSIHNDDIVKVKRYDEIRDYINNNDFHFIINNKFNNIFEISNELNKKFSVISHNSMDPFNRLILDNNKSVDKVFTINKIHSDLFIENRLKSNIIRYINYVDSNYKVKCRDNFKFRLVFIGRLSKEKNVNLLLDAFEKLERETNLNLELIILGDGKSEFIRDSKNVKYFGKVNFNMIKFILVNSDYLVLPSSVEGLPFTVLEAMSLGIPCICSNINGINELINEDNGFLFGLKNYENYKKNIDNWKILDDYNINYNYNMNSLFNKIKDAYSINISRWNILSENSFNIIKNNYDRKYVDNYNYLSFNLFL